jgi:L-lactate utilization protein LutB
MVNDRPPKAEDMDQVIARTIKALGRRQIQGWAAADAAEAREIVLRIVPPEAVVGTGDSTSVRQVGVGEALRARGNRLINGFAIPSDVTDVRSLFEKSFWPMLEATLCDVFLTGSNAVTEDGRLVNVDGAGNRVAGMFWGHPTTVLIVGRNKIVKSLDEALDRVKNVIAPEHLRRKGAPTPCTKSGHCHDCVGPTKVCAVTAIIERKPPHTDIHVVIVDEDLGLGWDRSWPEERIDSIVARHEEFMALCPLRRAVEDGQGEETAVAVTRGKRSVTSVDKQNRFLLR